MTCEVCGRGIKDGVALHRQNEKGVPGVWRCTACNQLPIPDDVDVILSALAQDERDRRGGGRD